MTAPMNRKSLISQEAKNRKAIEMILFTTGKKAWTIADICRMTTLTRSTVRAHLNDLVRLNRVHVEKAGIGSIYYINGKYEFTNQVDISPGHRLFLDMMVDPHGSPFLRIKEQRRQENGDWKNASSIKIEDVKEIDEITKALTAMKPKFSEYGVKEPVYKVED